MTTAPKPRDARRALDPKGSAGIVGMANTLIVNRSAANHAEWQKEICPGCYFVWFMPEFNKTLYSEVLGTPKEVQDLGIRRTETFTDTYPQGHDIFVRINAACMLLSREQWDIARALGWPQDEPNIMKVLDLPPS